MIILLLKITLIIKKDDAAKFRT